jgi:hypothetical protein
LPPRVFSQYGGSGPRANDRVRPPATGGGSQVLLAASGRAGRSQPLMLGVNIPHLEPEHHRVPGSAIRVPGDFQKACADKEDHPGIGRRAELAVDRQAQHVPVEVAASAQYALSRDKERLGHQAGRSLDFSHQERGSVSARKLITERGQPAGCSRACNRRYAPTNGSRRSPVGACRSVRSAVELGAAAYAQTGTGVLFRLYGFGEGDAEIDFAHTAQTWALILDRLASYLADGIPQPFFPAPA